MNREQFVEMLSSRPELSAEGARFVVSGEATVDLLLVTASGGPAPIPRLTALVAGDAFVTAETDESIYVLPYIALMGLKVTPRGPGAGGRRSTGFV